MAWNEPIPRKAGRTKGMDELRCPKAVAARFGGLPDSEPNDPATICPFCKKRFATQLEKQEHQNKEHDPKPGGSTENAGGKTIHPKLNGGAPYANRAGGADKPVPEAFAATSDNDVHLGKHHETLRRGGYDLIHHSHGTSVYAHARHGYAVLHHKTGHVHMHHPNLGGPKEGHHVVKDLDELRQSMD